MLVLFVEDDTMNRQVVRDMLGVADVVMHEAPSGLAGLELVDRDDYDLVLMDLRMPGMDGFATIRAIRARADAKAEVPIIAVTADTAPDLRERVIAAGGDDVLFKPVAFESLFDAIGRLMAPRDHQL